tara:strand:- start:599 stop:817 length:219 start_codon:yes stop_codon:yes gene_type:complete
MTDVTVRYRFTGDPSGVLSRNYIAEAKLKGRLLSADAISHTDYILTFTNNEDRKWFGRKFYGGEVSGQENKE